MNAPDNDAQFIRCNKSERYVQYLRIKTYIACKHFLLDFYMRSTNILEGLILQII